MEDALTVGLVSVVYRLEWETARDRLTAYLAHSGLSSFAARERALAGQPDLELFMRRLCNSSSASV